MIRPKRMAKLDMYDYSLDFNGNHVTKVRIVVGNLHDPIIADISGEVKGNEGFMYVEGYYLKFIEMSVVTEDSQYLLDIEVLEI